MTVGGGAVRFPIEAGGALKDIIEAPSLEVVRGLDARTNIGYAVEAAATSASEPMSMRTMSAPTTSGGSRSLRGSCGTPSRPTVLRDLLPAIITPTRSWPGATMTSCRGRTTSTSTTSSPTARSILDAGRFAWEQAADDYGRLVVDWVSGGYRRVGPQGKREERPMETTHEQTTTDPHTDDADASIKRVTAENSIEYAYRDLGEGDVPLVLLHTSAAISTTGIQR